MGAVKPDEGDTLTGNPLGGEDETILLAAGRVALSEPDSEVFGNTIALPAAPGTATSALATKCELPTGEAMVGVAISKLSGFF